jgi:hypothetical protein
MMKRRHFIGMAATGAGGLVLHATGGDEELRSLAVLAQPQLLQILDDEFTVHDLGRRYREHVPAEDNADALVQLLAVDAATAPRALLRAHLTARVQRDFESGRTITLNGWILSLTEARQCALYSLIRDQRQLFASTLHAH